MENNQNINQELEQMREQFKMLTEKVEKQNIVTDKLIHEVSKNAIYKYRLVEHWGFAILLPIVAIYGIYQNFSSGFPFWTSLSYIYMIGLVLWIAYKDYIREREYIESINYDLETYWARQDALCEYKIGSKVIYRVLLKFLPIVIHSFFWAHYLYSIGEVNVFIDYWWLCTVLILCVVFLLGLSLAKYYRRAILNLFRDKKDN